MTTMESLIKIKKEVMRRDRYINKDEIEVKFQFGICSQAAGILDVIKAMNDAVFDQDIKNVTFKKAGCSGLCFFEPIVIIGRRNERPVTYVNVTPEKARILLSEFALKGRIIRSWTLSGKEVNS